MAAANQPPRWRQRTVVLAMAGWRAAGWVMTAPISSATVVSPVCVGWSASPPSQWSDAAPTPCPASSGKAQFIADLPCDAAPSPVG